MRHTRFSLRLLLATPIVAGLIVFSVREALRGEICPAHSESQTIEFIVLDAGTLEGITGAVVSVSGPNYQNICPPTSMRGTTEGIVRPLSIYRLSIRWWSGPSNFRLHAVQDDRSCGRVQHDRVRGRNSSCVGSALLASHDRGAARQERGLRSAKDRQRQPLGHWWAGVTLAVSLEPVMHF